MPDEPIEILPGVYRTPGGREVTGLCVVIDNQDGGWNVATSDYYSITINIKKNAAWKAEEFTDPKSGKKKVRIFCEGGKLNSVALNQFIHPTEEVCVPNGHAADNEWPEVRIFYTTPRDSNAPPIKRKAR